MRIEQLILISERKQDNQPRVPKFTGGALMLFLCSRWMKVAGLFLVLKNTLHSSLCTGAGSACAAAVGPWTQRPLASWLTPPRLAGVSHNACTKSKCLPSVIARHATAARAWQCCAVAAVAALSGQLHSLMPKGYGPQRLVSFTEAQVSTLAMPYLAGFHHFLRSPGQ